MDELVSDRPGTRFGPRAIRAAGGPPGPQLETGVDAMAELRVVDFGDAPVVPADPARLARRHPAHRRRGGDAGPIPIVLGGDHSIAAPDVRACAERHGPLGLLHFDTHTDTAREVYGVELSHGTPMFRLVQDGYVDPRHYVQVGLRGYWPGPEELAWQARARHHRDPDARGARRGHRRGARAGARGGRRPAGIPDGRRGRARPGLRPRHRHPGARRDDGGRPPVGVPPQRGAAAARRGGRRRGRADGGRRGGHDRARRRSDRARDPDGDRASPATSGHGRT